MVSLQKLLLLLAYLGLILISFIWGTSYVFQKIANSLLDPFFYTGLRFLVGAIAIVPIYLFLLKKNLKQKKTTHPAKNSIQYGFVTGVILICAIMLQQIGLFYTSASKAGFISGMYVIFTPFVCVYIFREKKESVITYLICLFALFGIAVLSFKNNELTFNLGDTLMILSALFWALQIVYISSIANKIDVILFSIIEFTSCSVLCFIIAAILQESFSLQAINEAIEIILFTGVVSVGVCFSVQVLAQKYVSSISIAVILSLETIFATLAEAWILEEFLSVVEIIGCVMILSAIICMQLYLYKKNKKQKAILKKL